MADERKTQSIQLTNDGEGPRSFFAADGSAVILRPGESYEGDILAADVDALSSDLRQGGADADGDASPEADQIDLDGMDKAQLLDFARQRGFDSIVAQPDLAEDDIRAAIALAMETEQSSIQGEADALVKANTRDQLVAIAADEGVAIESDANKATIAFAIADSRYHKDQG